MNKYVVTFEWCDYNFYNVFEGENENDPKMRQKIIEWISIQADGSLADNFTDEDREDAYLDLQCYQIAQQVNMGNIAGEVWDDIEKANEEGKKQRKKQEEDNERRELERLKNKFKE